MAVVVDTDVASYIFKEDTRKELYKQHLDGQFMFLSFMTAAEMRFWALTSSWGARRTTELEKYLRRYSIQHSTMRLCELWAEVKNGGKRSGKNIDDPDAWIAATALYINVPLVTHNAADFQHVSGLSVISEQ